MKNNDHLPPPDTLPEVVIPKENAVFWMDDQGRWHNRHGRFEHKRIIDHFNRSIRRDRDGYYVTQERSGIREKVYFAHSGTPLFVIRVVAGPAMQLELNTGATLLLDPEQLFICDDQLYQRKGRECIRFTDRALLALSVHLVETPTGLSICLDDRLFPIPEQGDLA